MSLRMRREEVHPVTVGVLLEQTGSRAGLFGQGDKESETAGLN